MSRYELRAVGVFDRELGRVITKRDTFAWQTYVQSVAGGNGVDQDSTAQSSTIALSERRARRKLAARRVGQLTSTRVSVAGTTFELNDDEALIVIGLAVSLLNGNALPAAFAWRNTVGVLTPLAPAQLANMAQRIVEKRYAHLARRWQLEATIDAAVDPDAVPLDFSGL